MPRIISGVMIAMVDVDVGEAICSCKLYLENTKLSCKLYLENTKLTAMLFSPALL